MRTCEKCGIENRTEAIYCSSCGENLIGIVNNKSVSNDKKFIKWNPSNLIYFLSGFFLGDIFFGFLKASIIVIAVLLSIGNYFSKNWKNIRWVSNHYRTDFISLNPRLFDIKYFSNSAKKYMTLYQYVDYRKIPSHNTSCTASVVEIVDTDSPEWKKVVYDDGAECTFTFENGKWRRAFDSMIYDNALDEYDQMQYATSVQSMFSVIETDPYDPRGYLLLSRDYRLYHQAPNYLNQSLIYAKKAMSVAKFTRSKEVKSLVYFNLADLYRELGNEKMEIEYCRSGFKVNPDNYAANYFFGSALVRNGRISEGLIYLKKCYALEPDNPLIWGYFLDHPELKKPIMD